MFVPIVFGGRSAGEPPQNTMYGNFLAPYRSIETTPRSSLSNLLAPSDFTEYSKNNV